MQIPYDQPFRDLTRDWTWRDLGRNLDEIGDPELARHVMRAYFADVRRAREFLIALWPTRFAGTLMDPARSAIVTAYEMPVHHVRGTIMRSEEVARGLGKTTLGQHLVFRRGLYAEESGIVELYRDQPTMADAASENLRELIPPENAREEVLEAYLGTPLGQLFPEARRVGPKRRWWLITHYGETPFWFSGFNGTIRGFNSKSRRPSLVSGDDLDKDEDVRTAGNRERRWLKLMGAVQGLGEAGRGLALILRGTRVSDDGLTGRASQDPAFDSTTLSVWISKPVRTDLWDQCRAIWADLRIPMAMAREQAARLFYEAHRAERDAGLVVIAPDRFTVFGLQVKRWQMGERAFSQEFENKILPSFARLLPMEVAVEGLWDGHYVVFPLVEEDGTLRPAPDAQRVLVEDCESSLWLDPRFSKDQEKNDFASISCVLRTPSGYLIELVTRIARVAPRDQRKLYWEIVDDLAEAGIHPRCGYEINGAGEDLWEEHWEAERAERRKAGKVAPRIHGKATSGNKKNRMGSMDRYIENGHLIFCTRDAEVRRQWRELSTDSREHDDAPDSTQCAIWFLDEEIDGDNGLIELMEGLGDLEGWR